MKANKTVVVAIKDLKMNLFVRKSLNQDHALYLATLMENGVKLHPIKITPENEVVDGRHRIEAHDLNSKTEIEAEIVPIEDKNEIIAEAYRSNVGGALPPTAEDTEHTVMLLLENDVPKTHIAKLLGLPAGMARTFISSVQSKMARAVLQRAAASVTDGGLTVAKAAEQYNVEPEQLKEILSGNRKKHRQGVQEIQRNFSKQYRSMSHKNANAIRNLLNKFEDGDVTEKQVRSMLDHLEKLQKNSARTLTQWRDRFNAIATVKKSA